MARALKKPVDDCVARSEVLLRNFQENLLRPKAKASPATTSATSASTASAGTNSAFAPGHGDDDYRLNLSLSDDAFVPNASVTRSALEEAILFLNSSNDPN